MKKSDTISDALEQRDFRPFDPKLSGPAFDGFMDDLLHEVRLRIMARRLAQQQEDHDLYVLTMPTTSAATSYNRPAPKRMAQRG